MSRLLLTLVAIFFTVYQAQTVLAECAESKPSIIIYQPLLSDIEQKDQYWQDRFTTIKEAGITTILLQWSGYGDVDFLLQPVDSTTQSMTFIDYLLTLAHAHKVKIIFGLWSDPDWFEHVNEDDQALRFYLRRLRERNTTFAHKINNLYGDHSSFTGWYLPEEIDDRNWQTVGRQQLLEEHVKTMTETLTTISGQYPVMISSYFSGNTSPEYYARRKTQQQQASGVIWLFQDGLGTDRLTEYQTGLYLSALMDQQKKQDLRWEGILEIFSQNSATGTIVSATTPEIRNRKNVWCDSTANAPKIIFSLRYLH